MKLKIDTRAKNLAIGFGLASVTGGLTFLGPAIVEAYGAGAVTIAIGSGIATLLAWLKDSRK